MWGHQSQSGTVRKIWSPPGRNPRNVGPVASLCADRAIPASSNWCILVKWNWSKIYGCGSPKVCCKTTGEQTGVNYILITNLMHWLLFIHKILFSSTRFESQVLIFRGIQLYTCSIWYCHSLWEFLVACRYTAWVRTDCGPHSQFLLKLCTDRPPGTLIESNSTICCMYTTVSSWRWALETRNM